MDIFVYSDESGVFDKHHNKIYVFGGLILLGKKSKDEWARRYLHAENTIRSNGSYSANEELKACKISNKEKGKLIRSLNHCYKFGVVIQQDNVYDRIFGSKKDKQRYLDYAYKIGLRRAFESLINKGIVRLGEVDNVRVYVDEHTTATNGRYELREALEQEFKNGTYNYNFTSFHEPIFPGLTSVELQFCNSEKVPLIRAADLVANRIYHDASVGLTWQQDKLHIAKLP